MKPVTPLLSESARTVGRWARAQIIIVGAEIAMYAIGFAILHVPLWPVVAVLCGVTYLVPSLGSLIALGIALFAAFLGGADLWQLGYVMAVWLVVQAVEGFFLTPRILGRSLGLRPLYVFFAVIVGGALLGPLGVVLAVPALAVGGVVYRYFRQPSLPVR